MKFVVAVLAVLALASPMSAWKVPRTGTGALADELQAFVDIIPLDKMVNILLEYVSEDAEFQKLLTFISSKEFTNLVLDIEHIPEVVQLINYIQNAGVDAYFLVNKLNKYLGLPPMKKSVMGTFKITGGIRGFLDDIEALVPVDKIKQLYDQKMATSQVFRNLMATLRSPITQKIADTVFANPNFVAILDKAEKAGVDVPAVKEFLRKFLGLDLPLHN